MIRRPRATRRLVPLLGATIVLVAAACAPSGDNPRAALPPAGVGFDYQLGGAYPPPDGVVVVARDRTDPPAGIGYDICYVNGFQTQPDELGWWMATHPDLVLRDRHGDPIVDPDWPDEALLDIGTPDRRTAIAAIVGGWIDDCGHDGYDAVEVDNLDSYTRSQGAITADDAVTMIRSLADRAHAAGLAIGQKNAAELLPRTAETDLDFAVAEECNRFDECGAYVRAYGAEVFVIEYRDDAFRRGCEAFPQLSTIRRDVLLQTPDHPDHRYEACEGVLG